MVACLACKVFSKIPHPLGVRIKGTFGHVDPLNKIPCKEG